MDSVVVLEHGTVVEVKPYDKMKAPVSKSAPDDETDSEQHHETTDESAANIQSHAPSVLEDPEIELEKDSLRRRGGSWSVYSYYCTSAGVVPLVLWVGFTFVGAVTATYTGKSWVTLVRHWPKANLRLQLYGYSNGRKQMRSILMSNWGSTSGFTQCW